MSVQLSYSLQACMQDYALRVKRVSRELCFQACVSSSTHWMCLNSFPNFGIHRQFDQSESQRFLISGISSTTRSDCSASVVIMDERSWNVISAGQSSVLLEYSWTQLQAVIICGPDDFAEICEPQHGEDIELMCASSKLDGTVCVDREIVRVSAGSSGQKHATPGGTFVIT